MMLIFAKLRLVPLCAIACVFGTSGRAFADVQALIKTAQDRSEASRAVIVELEVKEFVAKGQLSSNSPFKGSSSKAVPEEDVVLTSRNKLYLLEQMVRFENNHPIWNIDRGQVLKTSAVVVSNGTTGTLYLPSGVSGQEPRASGIIWANASPEGLRPSFLTPLSSHFRALSANFAPYPYSTLARKGKTTIVSGKECVEYQAQSNHPDRIVSIFIDERSQYVLRRMQKLSSGHLTQQLDVDYREYSARLLPQSWTVSEFGVGGRLKSKLEVSIAKIEFDVDTSRSLFDTQFLPGTSVFDQKTGKDYMVQSDGMLREVSPSGELIGPEVPQPGTTWLSRNKIAMVASFCAVLLATLVAVWLRRAHKASSRLNTPGG